MGGFGSGWHRGRKLTVENCVSLVASQARRAGHLPNGCSETYLPLTHPQTGERVETLHYAFVENKQGFRILWLRSMVWQDKRLDLEQRIPLMTTRPYFGGVRWWFACLSCQRRVGRLYLPPGRNYFACRHCYNLTYRSAQEHDKRFDHDGWPFLLRLWERMLASRRAGRKK